MRIVEKGILLMMLATFVCAAVMAQDNDTSKKPLASRSVANAKMPPPPQASPEMAKLIQMMSGTWTVAEKYEPSPMFPTGGSGQGTAKFWAGPGGMSLLEDYHSIGAIGKFSGFGTTWWDPKAQAYRGVWCDSMTPNGCDSSGISRWDGETLSGMLESEMNGQKMVTRITYTNWAPNSFVMIMSTGPDANSLKDIMTDTYTKAAAAKTGQ